MEDDGVDEIGLLARALERAGRCAEQTRKAVAEAALVRAEREADAAQLAAARKENAALLEAHRSALEERASLRSQLERSEEAREVAEEAAKRFQALAATALHQPPPGSAHASPNASPVRGKAGGVMPMAECYASATAAAKSPPAAGGGLGAAVIAGHATPATVATPGAAAAAAAVDDLEAAVRDAAALAALFKARPSGL